MASLKRRGRSSPGREPRKAGRPARSDRIDVTGLAPVTAVPVILIIVPAQAGTSGNGVPMSD